MTPKSHPASYADYADYAGADAVSALLSLIDNAPDVISRFDRDGRYLFISRAAERYTGIPREAFLGRTYRELGFPEEACALWDDALRRCFDGGDAPEVLRFTVPVPGPDGTRRPRHYEGHSVPERGPDGRVVSVLTVTRDITERVEARGALEERTEELRATAERLRRAADIFRLTDQPLVVGSEGTRAIELCNPAFARLYGYGSPEEMVGVPIVECYAPAWRGRVEGFIRRAHREGRVRYEAEHRRRDGTVFPVELDMTAVRDDDGRVLYRIVSVTDLSERRRAEAERAAQAAALAAGDARLRLALDAARMGVWEWEIATGALTWDGRLEEIHGLAPGAFDGRYETFLACLHPDDRERAGATIARALESGDDAFFTEHRVVFAGGEVRWLAGRGTVVRDADGRPVRMIGVGWDITDRKRAEEENARLLEEQRRFLRDVLFAVTDGTLLLCDTDADLPPPLAPESGPPIPLCGPTSPRALRLAAASAADACGLSADRYNDLLTAVGEAAMNVVTHAEGRGRGSVLYDARTGTVQIRIADDGPGIPMERLHRAVLERGFTTAGTLGHGFWLMLHTADRVHLLTGRGGTTVVIEKGRIPPQPGWLGGATPPTDGVA